jgi:hypothetical protein
MLGTAWPEVPAVVRSARAYGRDRSRSDDNGVRVRRVGWRTDPSCCQKNTVYLTSSFGPGRISSCGADCLAYQGKEEIKLVDGVVLLWLDDG